MLSRITVLLFLVSFLIGCGETKTETFPTIAGNATETAPPTETRSPAPMIPPPITQTNSPTPPSPSVTPTQLPAFILTPTLTATPAPTATPTPIPPPLPLRDDLPPLELSDWSRPAKDNGECIHFLATGYYQEAELDKQIARMKELKLKWALVLYGDENYLETAARKFKDAGIMVVWRKTLRPYQHYLSWGRDINVLKAVGMPPYMQLYNEPELLAEWDGFQLNREQFFSNLLQASKDVYNAGGYVGWQFLDEDTLRAFINEIYAREGDALFHRMFFVPHAYGGNHPPEYIEDTNGVLGFRAFATIFLKRLGFVPPFVVGEGGWKVGNQEDKRFSVIDEKLHRDYTLAVFKWFQTGKMSNGAAMPDYLFAFCHWMLSGGDEAGAWYDSSFGSRTLTIEAVKDLPAFTRKFSWEK